MPQQDAGTSTARPAPSGGSLWRNRDFMLLWGGQSVSLVGSQVTQLALPLAAALVLGASTFQVGLLGAVGALGQTFFALPGGVLADRGNKRRTMLVCDAVRALTLGWVAVAAVLHVLTFGQLVAAIAVNGVCDALHLAAYRSLPAVIVGRERLLEVNSKFATAFSFAAFVGPGLGGLLVAALGAARAIGADALSYALNALSLTLVRHREPARAPRAADPGEGRAAAWRARRREVGAGLRFVLRDPVQRTLTASLTTVTFMINGSSVLMVLYAVRDLHWTPHALGLVLAVGSLGGVLGGAVSTRWIARGGPLRVITVAAWVYAPGELVITLVRPGLAGQACVALGYVVLLITSTCNNVALQTYRQQSCPPELLGRMSSAVTFIARGPRPLAALLAGFLGTTLGLRRALVCFALGLLITPLLQYVGPLRRAALAVPVGGAGAEGEGAAA